MSSNQKKTELLNQVLNTDLYKSFAIKMSEEERINTENYLSDFIEPFSMIFEALEQCKNDPELLEQLHNSMIKNDDKDNKE